MVMAYLMLKVFILIVCACFALTALDGFDSVWHFLAWAAAVAIGVGIIHMGFT